MILTQKEQEREAALEKEALQRREREAALKKEEKEREAALMKEEAALQLERESEQLEARKLHLEMQREHDKRQAESVLEYRRQELNLETTHHTQRQQATASLPVSFNISNASKLMPLFVESDVDVFFTTFEVLADKLKWPEDHWSTLLRVHLTGRAAIALSTLASENDYQTLKQAVLDAYLLSTESYRRKFRDYIKASSTTFLELANTKKRYFMKWLEAAHVSTFSELVNLILVEEFFRRIPAPIRLYLADKEETDYIRCAKSADTYNLIHKVPTDTYSSKKSWSDYDKGSLERSHQTINALLKKFCNETMKDWDKQLDLIMCIFRSLPNESLGVCPYEMLYGHKPDLAAMKLKLEIAKIEREQQREALEQQKEALQIKEREIALKERETALRKEEQEREIAILREPKVQESDEVSPLVLVTTRAQAAQPQSDDSTDTAVPQDPQKLLPNLTTLEFQIQPGDLYITGSDNIIADALSRVYEVEATPPITLPHEDVSSSGTAGFGGEL
ncbi:uncharacterized protein [Procambarus clarkii]|uniref:uncharacterized protein n=1 Tax=Procambarus clarkii TaxID=6728 RepID=UPI00374331E3